MTLTADRRVELLAMAGLFADVDAEGMERIAARAIEVDFPADHVIARQGEIGTGFFVVVTGGARVIRDGEIIAQGRAGRVLRGAVGAGRPAARRAGRRRRTDDAASPSRRGTSKRSLREEPAVALAVVRELARRLRDLTEARHH